MWALFFGESQSSVFVFLSFLPIYFRFYAFLSLVGVEVFLCLLVFFCENDHKLYLLPISQCRVIPPFLLTRPLFVFAQLFPVLSLNLLFYAWFFVDGPVSEYGITFKTHIVDKFGVSFGREGETMSLGCTVVIYPALHRYQPEVQWYRDGRWKYSTVLVDILTFPTHFFFPVCFNSSYFE